MKAPGYEIMCQWDDLPSDAGHRYTLVSSFSTPYLVYDNHDRRSVESLEVRSDHALFLYFSILILFCFYLYFFFLFFLTFRIDAA